MRLLRAISAALFVCLAVVTHAQTTIHVPADQPTIQAGINAAHNGDTVLVSPGTYNENIDFKGKAITVISSAGTAVTIIDGGSKGPAVTFATDELRTSVLSNFTITHGGREFSENTTPFQEPIGGVYISESQPTLINNTITQNHCWGIQTNFAAPLIQGNEISATRDPNGSCSFGGGAGIYVGGNYNEMNGMIGDGTPALIFGNTIENNVESGLEDAGGNGGAGIASWSGSPIILNNIIRNNSSPNGNGGAINFINATGVVVENLIYGNSAGCGGGALAFNIPSIAPGTSLLIANNTIVDNTGSGSNAFSNCASISQLYPAPEYYGSSTPKVVFVNNIISGSTSYPTVNCSSTGTPSETIQPIFQNNLLYNAAGQFFGAFCVDVSGKYNNVVADPQFVSSSTGDFHLKSTSPAIDSGDNTALQTFVAMAKQKLSTDFEGNLRILDVLGKGCIVDIGAYEYPGTHSICSTTLTLQSSLNPSTFGQTVAFTAQLSSPNGTPTGSVQFSDGANILGTEAVSAAGVATFSTGLLTAGSHTITAIYQPTGSFPSTSATVTQVVTGYSSTTAAITSSLNPSAINQPVTFTATVTSSNGTPTGAIAFTDGVTTLGTQPLDPSGHTTLTTSTLTIGSHTIMATYVPTGLFQASSSSIPQQVNGIPVREDFSAAPGPFLAGQSVNFMVTVTTDPVSSNIPTGSITFIDNTGFVVLGSAPLDAAGRTTFSTTAITPGNHTIFARYDPTGLYASISEVTFVTVLSAYPTSIAVSSLPASSYLGQPVTLNAVLSSPNATPLGTFTLSEGATVLASETITSSNWPMLSVTLTPTLGNHHYVAVFTPSPSATISGSTSADDLNVQVPSSSISIGSSLNPSVINQPVTYSAIVTGPNSPQVGTPAGTITFTDGNATLGTVPLDASGHANITSAPSTVGNHTITAAYTPSNTFTSGFATLTQQVLPGYPTSTALASSSPTSVINQPVTFSAAVGSSNGTPTGAVTFTDGTTTLGTQPLDPGGHASLSTSGLAVGSHTVTATYIPTGSFAASSGSVTQQVLSGYPTATILTATPNPATYNQSVSLIATLASASTTPLGTLTISDGVTVLGSETISASGWPPLVFTSSAFTIGTHNLTATYTPGTGATAAGSSASVTLVILPSPTNTTLAASPNPSDYSQSVVLSATVAGTSGGTPTGSIQFLDAPVVLATVPVDASGHASFSISTLTAGQHFLTAAYLPAGNFATSTSPVVTQLVHTEPTATTLSASPVATTSFQPIALTATVVHTGAATLTPIGTVFLMNGPTKIDSTTLDAAGIATFTAQLPAGVYSLAARYLGTSNINGTTSAPLTITVLPAATVATVAASPNPAVQHQTVTFSSAVSSALAIPVVSGLNTTPTGTMSFYEGASLIATSAVSSTATATAGTSALTPGTHSLTAVYSGDTNYRPSTSAIFTETVTPQDYTLTAPPISIQAEHHAPLAISITTVGALTDTLNLSCSSLPQWAICYFDKSSIALDASASTYSATVTIDTDEVHYFAHTTPPSPGSNHRTPIIFAAVILGALALIRRRQTRIRLLTFLLATGALTATLSGCSGQYPEHTAPGTYNIQIDGITVNGHLAHSVTVPLTVTE